MTYFFQIESEAKTGDEMLGKIFESLVINYESIKAIIVDELSPPLWNLCRERKKEIKIIKFQRCTKH